MPPRARSACAALAACLTARPAAALNLDYVGRLAGLDVLHTRLVLTTDAAGYLLRCAITMAGGAAALVHGHSDILVQGAWSGDFVTARHVDSEAIWNGTVHRLVMDTVDGVPVVRILLPPDPHRRAALQRSDTAGSVDALGLVVGLMRQVQRTGSCDLQARVFDGHGLTEFASHTIGDQPVPNATPPASALRCDFTTSKLPGPDDRDDPPPHGRVQHGSAWFAAPAPGLPPVPLRIAFHTAWTGDAVLVLTGAAP